MVLFKGGANRLFKLLQHLIEQNGFGHRRFAAHKTEHAVEQITHMAKTLVNLVHYPLPLLCFQVSSGQLRQVKCGGTEGGPNLMGEAGSHFPQCGETLLPAQLLL